MSQPLLKIENLHIGIEEENKYRALLKGLNLEINALEIFALVGTSGSGKTTAGLSILRLLAPPIIVENGKILFEGENLLEKSASQMRQLRGKDIGMIFQEPLSAFNPLFTIGFQIEETLKHHTSLKSRQIQERVYELLHMVEIADPRRVAKSYPHQISGGMRQRAMIAQAIAGGPRLIIADEPTSNLDVTIQAHILELFKKLRSELKISMLLITHDLGVVYHLADRVGILYDGCIVELGKPQDVLFHPRHPLTCELAETLTL